MKLGLIVSGSLLAAFVAVTWWALESGGVAIITTGPADSQRTTHVWYVETDDELWLEAGTPENGWFVDVRTDPEIVIEIDGRSRRRRAVPIEDPSGHLKIRALLRDKYGFRDWWVGLLVDTSRSVAVRLAP